MTMNVNIYGLRKVKRLASPNAPAGIPDYRMRRMGPYGLGAKRSSWDSNLK
jgi:hypothetical protein